MKALSELFCERDIFARARAAFMLEVYSLAQGKGIQQLVYDELLKQVKESPQIDRLFREEKIMAYHAHEPVRNTVKHPDLYITQIRYYRMYNFFKENFPGLFDVETEVLNIGDPSGNLLQVLGKQGTSLNINRECVNFIKNKGLEAILGNAENLEFEDSSFDYVFSFQCLEHISNPIRALNEFGRVAREKVFLSIPYTSKTVIYNINTWIKLQKESWQIEGPKDFDCHIFEFSTENFIDILSHTNLEYEGNFPIYYFDNDTFIRRLLNRYLKSYFNFFILAPKKR